MRKLLTLLLLSVFSHAYSQDWPLKNLVANKKALKVAFTNIPAFTFITDNVLLQRGTYQELSLNNTFSKQLLEQKPDAIEVSIPLSKTTSITCELIRFSLGNIKYSENNTGIIDNVKIPLTYRGIVSGVKNRNTVTLTVTEDYISMFASMSDRVIQVTKADEKNISTYRLYNSAKVQFPIVPVNCGTKEKPAPQSDNGILLNGIRDNMLAVQDKCVNVFVDCSDSMYRWRNSNQQSVINYVYELFNSVTTGYFNDSVNIQLLGINVWTTNSPYAASTRSAALTQVAAYWRDNFFGNICVGLDYGNPGRSGVAGDIGRVKGVAANTCPAYDGPNNLSACCYCDLNYNVTVQNFPIGPNTTQSQVYLVMHEMGHLLGAHHTKWCGWKLSSNPDTYGAIDSCGVIEGGCAQGPPPPPNGATIMSYCVTSNLNGNFVSYYNGFGQLPGNAIRNLVAGTACIINCTDCFGWHNNRNIMNDDSSGRFLAGSAKLAGGNKRITVTEKR